MHIPMIFDNKIKKIKWKGNKKFIRVKLSKEHWRNSYHGKIILIRKPDSICSRIYLLFFRDCHEHPYLSNWYVKKCK